MPLQNILIRRKNRASRHELEVEVAPGGRLPNVASRSTERSSSDHLHATQFIVFVGGRDERFGDELLASSTHSPHSLNTSLDHLKDENDIKEETANDVCASVESFPASFLTAWATYLTHVQLQLWSWLWQWSARASRTKAKANRFASR